MKFKIHDNMKNDPSYTQICKILFIKKIGDA